ncbi:MAG: glucose-6-phosphate isomerase family protein [Candidatus Dojkabacteria bacterium]|nr:glucose-6-phosphate isomerase family protein [Candidatus Dojkabacteria bacterium]
MINLQDFSGLPLLLNNQDNSLHPAGEISFEKLERIRLDTIRPVLLNKTLKYPLNVYTEYSDIYLNKDKSIFAKNKLHYSIIILPPGLLGIEYNKTHIFSPDKDQNDITAIVDIIHGKGTVIVQQLKEKGELDFETDVSFVAAFKVKKGDRVPIPQKYMYTFINSSSLPLIVGRLYEDDGKIDYRTMKKEHGMSYYFIRKNARQEIVRNPHYKDVPRLKRIKAEDYCKKFRLTAAQPIYTQFIYNPDRFKKLLV